MNFQFFFAKLTSRATVFAVCLWSTACFSISPSHAQQSVDMSSQMTYEVRPGVRFLTPTTAEFRWESNLPGQSVVAYGTTRKLGEIAISDASGTFHEVVIDDLKPGKTYWYRFGTNQDGRRLFSEFYELEGKLNYTPPQIETQHGGNPLASEIINAAIPQLRQRGGYAVVSGDLDPVIAEMIAAQTQMTVIVLASDSDQKQTLRHRWYKQDLYGIRLSVQERETVPAEFANLIVVPANEFTFHSTLIAPLGEAITIGKTPGDDEFQWKKLSENLSFGTRSQPPELAAWGHQYGSIANASYSGEDLGGVDDTANLKVKWIGKPGADFGIDRNPRMPAPLAVGGRLFHQGMNRMIALDAFNGAVLWSLEIPDLRRVNIPRDAANWCADERTVYAAVKEMLWEIDAATGEMRRTLTLPEQFQGTCEWGYVGVTDEFVIGTPVKEGSTYTNFWDKASWYDGKDDAATAKVCGNAVVAYDKEYGSIAWEHPADAVVNSTITVHGSHVYFVQVDDPALKKLSTGKLVNAKIWNAASVVCLDLKTGKQLWKAKVPPQDHEAIVSFGIADEDQFVLQTSGKNQFHFASFDANSGSSRWNQSAQWPEDHHGAHVQHAVLMKGKLMVQPHIIDAVDGTILKSGTLGKRRGCATPIGAGNSIIYRGGSGPLTLWSLDSDTTSEFARLRPSCWLSTVPAQGMLFSPEGGGGCSCGGWMETSIGFAPVTNVPVTNKGDVQ